MKVKPTLSQKRLKEVLNYDPMMGVFTWKIQRCGKGRIGQVAGCKDSAGYIRIAVDRKLYYGHRLAWLYVHGYFPEHTVDHINQNKSDNRLANLRHVTQRCNCRNIKTREGSMSGVKGVRLDGRTNSWSATISVGGRTRTIASFESLDNAVCARLAAEQCLGWNGCDMTSPAFQYVRKNINSNAR